MTLDEFGRLVISSGLVRKNWEPEFRAQSIDGSALAYAAFLVAQGALTEWQCQKLFTGKYKGFFLDHYKLLSQLDSRGNHSRYLAEDLHTGAQAMLRVYRGLKLPYDVDPIRGFLNLNLAPPSTETPKLALQRYDPPYSFATGCVMRARPSAGRRLPEAKKRYRHNSVYQPNQLTRPSAFATWSSGS